MAGRHRRAVHADLARREVLGVHPRDRAALRQLEPAQRRRAVRLLRAGRRVPRHRERGRRQALRHERPLLVAAPRASSIPPQADAGWIGEAGPGPSYLDPGSGGPENDFTNRNTTFMTWNLLHLARMLVGLGRDPRPRQPALGVGRGLPVRPAQPRTPLTAASPTARRLPRPAHSPGSPSPRLSPRPGEGYALGTAGWSSGTGSHRRAAAAHDLPAGEHGLVDRRRRPVGGPVSPAGGSRRPTGASARAVGGAPGGRVAEADEDPGPGHVGHRRAGWRRPSRSRRAPRASRGCCRCACRHGTAGRPRAGRRAAPTPGGAGRRARAPAPPSRARGARPAGTGARPAPRAACMAACSSPMHPAGWRTPTAGAVQERRAGCGRRPGR